MSEKRNIRDHKRRLLAAKYELRRNSICKDLDLPSDMRGKHRYKLSKLPRKSAFARVRNHRPPLSKKCMNLWLLRSIRLIRDVDPRAVRTEPAND